MVHGLLVRRAIEEHRLMEADLKAKQSPPAVGVKARGAGSAFGI